MKLEADWPSYPINDPFWSEEITITLTTGEAHVLRWAIQRAPKKTDMTINREMEGRLAILKTMWNRIGALVIEADTGLDADEWLRTFVND